DQFRGHSIAAFVERVVFEVIGHDAVAALGTDLHLQARLLMLGGEARLLPVLVSAGLIEQIALDFGRGGKSRRQRKQTDQTLHIRSRLSDAVTRRPARLTVPRTR